jgi:hypothetical protein
VRRAIPGMRWGRYGGLGSLHPGQDQDGTHTTCRGPAPRSDTIKDIKINLEGKVKHAVFIEIFGQILLKTGFWGLSKTATECIAF